MKVTSSGIAFPAVTRYFIENGFVSWYNLRIWLIGKLINTFFVSYYKTLDFFLDQVYIKI